MKSFVVFALLGSALAFPAAIDNKKPTGSVALPSNTDFPTRPTGTNGVPHPQPPKGTSNVRPSGAKGNGRPQPSGVRPSGAAHPSGKGKGKGHAHPTGARPTHSGVPSGKASGRPTAVPSSKPSDPMNILPIDDDNDEEEKRSLEINYGLAARKETNQQSATVPKPTKTHGGKGKAKPTGVNPTGVRPSGRPHGTARPHGTGRPHHSGKPHGTGRPAFGTPRPTGARPTAKPTSTGKSTKPFFPTEDEE